jgi:dipeptidyl aminopeptidase/acylaminoacyl peptidase
VITALGATAMMALAVAGELGGGPDGAGGPARLEALDVFELEVAGDPRISPDGRTVVYERRAFDIYTDNTRTALWLVGVDGSDHRPLMADGGSYAAPRWSPGGDRIAFIGEVDGRRQILVRWLDSASTAVVSNLQHPPAHLSWSPDGNWLAFTMDIPEKPAALAEPPAKPEGAEWAPPAKLIDSVIYRFDGRGFVEPAHTQIFVVPATGGSPVQLTDAAFNHLGPLAWMADSTGILFSSNQREDWEYDRVASDLYRVSVEDRAVTRLTDTGDARNPVVSVDGGTVAFLSARNEKIPYRTSRVHLLDLGSGERQSLTDDLDRSVGQVSWRPRGRGLHLVYDDRGRRVLAHVTPDGRRRVLTDSIGGTSLGRPYVSGDVTVSRNGVAAFTLARPDRPADVAVLDRGKLRVLTDLNSDVLDGLELGTLHEIVYPSDVGGVEIQGWYLLPPGYEEGRRYPVILELHGGPHSAYGPVFSAEMQLMAAAGYVVFYDNYRGSTSYGEDFALLLKYRYSSPDEFGDHMAGLDRLIDAGIADPDRLFITGGSAGGIATLYAIGLTDRFRAAAAAKPIANWVSKTLTGDIYTSQISHQFPAPPWEAVEHYWERSPLSLVGNVATPTLLITGEEDYRTPISETEQYYQALKLRRVDTVMVRIPEASHGIAARPSRLIAKVANILAWFEKYDVPADD